VDRTALRPLDIVERLDPVQTEMGHYVVWVDAEAARDLLMFNREPKHGEHATNRKASRVRIQRYKEDMLNDQFGLSTQPLAFSTDDEQIDGQQRLKALIEADKERPGIRVPFIIVIGALPSAKMLIDQGKARIPGDYLKMAGEINTAVLASSAKLTYCVLNVPRVTPDSWRRIRWNAQIQEALLNEHVGLRQATQIALKVRRFIVASAGATFWYLASRDLGDPFPATVFMAKLDGGVVDDGGVISRFRRFLENNLYQSNGKRRDNDVQLAWTIKAFNAWLADDTHYVPGWRNNERWPKIIDKAAIADSRIKEIRDLAA
jgi:hypothetical protein